MESLIEKVSELLKSNFSGSTMELESTPSSRVSGFLIWSGFEDVEQIERQERLWHVLKTHLNKEEVSQVAAILTFTPDEMSVAREP